MPTVNLGSLPDDFLIPPVYGPTVSGRGTSMQVILSPRNDALPQGTATSAHYSIPGVMNQFHHVNPGKWVAAHLLNAILGGSGTAGNNLVPMTQTANKQMSSQFELKVKALINIVKNCMKQGYATGKCYGVHYVVQASATPFAGPVPAVHNLAPSDLTIAVGIVATPWTPPTGRRPVPFNFTLAPWTPVNAFAPDQNFIDFFAQFVPLPAQIFNLPAHLL
jgi:hypothetical protein